MAKGFQKKSKKNDEYFLDIRARVVDLQRVHAEDIRRNSPRAVCMGIVNEMDFLVRMIEHLTKGNPDKLINLGEPDRNPVLDHADEPESVAA